jgi:hypothetical protein
VVSSPRALVSVSDAGHCKSGTRSDIGVDTFTTILMQMPTGAIGILTLLIGIFFTNRFKTRWLVILCIVLPPIAGAVALTQVGRNEPSTLIACYYIIWLYGGIRRSRPFVPAGSR